MFTQRVKQRFVGLMLSVVLTGGALAYAPMAHAVTCDPGGGGAGTSAADPFLISTPAHLAVLATNADCRSAVVPSRPFGWFFKQTTNLTLTGTWTPIGTDASPFEGNYDGNGMTISGLSIPAATEFSGLFGRTTAGSITGVNLVGVSIVGAADADGLGALVGYASGTVISDSSSTGTVSGSGVSEYLGGLIGRVYALPITDVTSSVNVTLDPTRGTHGGGVVGLAEDSDITRAVATGSVSGLQSVGGLVGTFRVTGDNEGSFTIRDSSASGTVTSVQSETNSLYVGGLIGLLDAKSVSVDDPVSAHVINATASGDVSGRQQMGGLIGLVNTDQIVAGWPGLSIEDSSASGDVDGVTAVGGFVGQIYLGGGTPGTLTTSSAGGDVEGVDNVGGFAGNVARMAISEVKATGTVTATGTSAGGLIGEATSASSIVRSFASGRVIGNDYVGGLVGNFGENPPTSSIEDSYATGSVTGEWQVGGLIGKNQSPVSRSYALGAVIARQVQVTVGGIGGQNYGDRFTDAVWNPATTLQTSPGVIFDADGMPPISATGLGSTEMRTGSNFPGWNFSSIWGYQCDASTTPVLRWANPLATSTSAGPCSTPAPDPAPPAPIEPTVIPVAPVVPTEPLATDRPEPQAPTTSSMTIGGQAVEVVREVGARESGVTVSAGPVSMTVRSEAPDGRNIPVAADGALILARSGEVPIQASGLAPESVVTQTLFSDPIDLGSAMVDASGVLSAAPKIPPNTPLGNHTLSVRGTTNTGDPFTLNIGVTVATPAVALGADPLLTIKPARTNHGPGVNVTARGVQARCMVTFTSGKTSTKVRANAQGLARTTLTPVKARSGRVPVTMRVSGKGCEAITVQGNATVRTLSQV